jgi:hypothetical protein
MNNTKLRLLILLQLLIAGYLPIGSVYAQQNPYRIAKDTAIDVAYPNLQALLYAKGHWSIRAGGIWSGLQYIPQSGSFQPNSSLGLGFVGTLDYIENFSPNIGLRFGFSFGLMPNRMNIDIAYPYSGYPTGRAKESWNVPYEYIGFPIELVYHASLTQKCKLQMKGGVLFRKFLLENIGVGFEEAITTPQVRAVYYQDISLPTRFSTGITLSVGIQRLLKNYDFLGVHLISNLSLQDIADSTSGYTFFAEDPTYRSEGLVQTRGSYIGLELSYTYTHTKRQLKKSRIFR